VGSYSFSDLSVGMTSKRSYLFTEQRVETFSTLVDDKAPVHMDTEFAKCQGFAGRIVHGLFVQSVISGMLGNEIPGSKSVINNLSMKMHHPVLIGQTVNYQIEITALTSAVAAISLSFSGMVDENIVISGKALCSLPNPA
jgi:acyl dehydratase